MPDQNHKIDDALSALTVPMDVPELHPENTRIGDVSNIARSMDRFGQVRPILLQKSTTYIVAGNHTYKAAQELGWTHIAAVAVEMDDDEALAYLVADNRLGQLGGFDDAALARQLEQLMLNGKLEGTGYTPDEVDDLMAGLDALPEVEPAPTEAAHGTTDEGLAERFANRSQVQLRQFVLMYDQDVAQRVEAMYRRLERAWGVSGMRDVVLEALTRATQEPPIEGLTPEETARADAPVDGEATDDPADEVRTDGATDPEPPQTLAQELDATVPVPGDAS